MEIWLLLHNTTSKNQGWLFHSLPNLKDQRRRVIHHHSSWTFIFQTCPISSAPGPLPAPHSWLTPQPCHFSPDLQDFPFLPQSLWSSMPTSAWRLQEGGWPWKDPEAQQRDFLLDLKVSPPFSFNHTQAPPHLGPYHYSEILHLSDLGFQISD